MKNGLTIYDIAKLSGVSIATVSRVLNGNPKVNAKTREKVLQVIHQYGYVPMQSVRNFRERKRYTVALLMDDIRNPYVASLAHFISQEFNTLKISTVLCNIHNVESEFIEQVDNLINKKVNGIILIGSFFQNIFIRMLLEGRYSGMAFVSINGHFGLPNVCDVILDQQTAVEEAVTYLHSRGRCHIGFVYKKQSRSDERKFAGFMDGMRRCNLDSQRMIEINEKTIESGMQATDRLLSLWPDTDAVVFSSDTLAVGGAHFLNQQKIAIPKQIMLVGFNNSASACDCYPQLTSIDNNIDEAGKTAARLMQQMIRNEETEDVLIPSRLVFREST